MLAFDVCFRGATLTVSGCVEKPDGEPPYFVLEEVRCGDQDISNLIEPGSNQWLELEACCNRPEEVEIEPPFEDYAVHRGERAFYVERFGEPPV